MVVTNIPDQRFKNQLGIATLALFGKEIVVSKDYGGSLQAFFNIFWAVFFGWEIALAHLGHGIILVITIIGIPFAKQHFKLIPLALFPFGRELR